MSAFSVWLVIEDLNKYGTAIRGVFSTHKCAMANVIGFLTHRESLGEEWLETGPIGPEGIQEFRWTHESGKLTVIKKPVLT